MRNKEYWSARERASQLHIKEMVAKGADYDKAISAFYNASLTEINKEIASFYVKYATSEGLSLAEAKRKVSKMDVKAYEAQAAQYVKEKSFTAQANAELRLYNATMRINRLELLKAKIGMYAVGAGADLENYMTETLTDEAKAELRRQAGILGETIDHVNPEDVKHIVTGSYRADMAKYTMGKTTFSERIWGNNESLKGNLDRLLTQALINGKGPNALASDLRKQYDVSKYEASRLMRTESARVQGAAAIQNMLDHGIREYEWISEPDSKTCHECAALNGKRFKIEAGKVGENLIPLHPNCRCAIMPVDDDTIIQTGGKESSGGKHYEALDDTERSRKAANAYRKISRTNDIEDVAEASGMSVEDIKQIKRHVFYEKHDLYEGYGLFVADYDMAVAWKRLCEGKPKDRDIVLLRHELLESNLEKQYNLPIDRAHAEANKVYNWGALLHKETNGRGESDGLL